MKRVSTILKGAMTLAMGLCSLGAFAAVNYVADPNPDEIVSELSKVTLTFPDASIVDLGSQWANITVTSEDFSRPCQFEYGANDNQMIINFEKITETGTYTINVPEDAFMSDGNPIEAFTVTYHVEGGAGGDVESEATLVPAPGEVKWLYEVIFTDPSITYELNVMSYGEVQPTVTSPSGEVTKLISVFDYLVGAGKYRFVLRKLAVEPGEYTISFPANYMYYKTDGGDVFLPAMEFKYEVKGGELTQVISDPSVAEPTNNFNSLTLEFPGYETVAVKEGLTYTDQTVYVYKEGEDGSATSVMLGNFISEGNKLSYTNQYTDLIEEGHYYLTIPEGYILLGEEQTPCTPFIVEFDIVAPEPVVIDVTPANGTTVSMLNKATISFPEISYVDLGRSPNVSLYKVVVEDGEEKITSLGGAYSESAYTRLSDNSFSAVFNALATADGTYRIKVATNSFVYEGGFNQEYSVDVNFVAPKAPAYAITPENSEALPRLQNFTVTFPEESVVALNGALSSKTTTLYKGEKIEYSEYGWITNAAIGSTSLYAPVEGTTNSFSFTLSGAGLDAGKYVLSIPAGVFLIGEDENNFNGEIQVVYECNGEGLDKIEVTPSEPVKELTEVSVTYINETSISFQNTYAGFSLYKYVEGQTYGDYIAYLMGENLKIEGNTLFITLPDPIATEGVYYIDITAYSLYMSDGSTPSTPQSVYFTVDPNGTTAVESVEFEQNDNRIFNINGQEVKGMNAQGIYIVNGKKVIVR